MEIPLTALSTFTGIIVFSLALVFTGNRIRQNSAPVTRPVHLLRKFFAHMIAFFTIMTLPHLWLYVDPLHFPIAMAWGYTVGHIFLYTAFAYTARMFCVIMPRLASKEKLVGIGLGVVFNVIVTALTAATMIFGTLPVYDYERHITQFNASPFVGAAIGIFALLSLTPLAVLFLVRAFKTTPGQRLRPLLLGLGFVGMSVAGPLHDTAQNWQTFLLADIFTILSILLMGAGIVYRLEQGLASPGNNTAKTKTLTT
jgi:hypothetical protein